jgi:hypothetical protein
MNVKVYAIGGNWKWRNLTGTGDCYVGTASDTTTMFSLLDLVEKNGGYAVSLHGPDGENNTLSGEFLLNEARNYVQRIITKRMLPPISELVG